MRTTGERVSLAKDVGCYCNNPPCIQSTRIHLVEQVILNLEYFDQKLPCPMGDQSSKSSRFMVHSSIRTSMNNKIYRFYEVEEVVLYISYHSKPNTRENALLVK
jgi:hypothetical protein